MSSKYLNKSRRWLRQVFFTLPTSQEKKEWLENTKIIPKLILYILPRIFVFCFAASLFLLFAIGICQAFGHSFNWGRALSEGLNVSRGMKDFTLKVAPPILIYLVIPITLIIVSTNGWLWLALEKGLIRFGILTLGYGMIGLVGVIWAGLVIGLIIWVDRALASGFGVGWGSGLVTGSFFGVAWGLILGTSSEPPFSHEKRNELFGFVLFSKVFWLDIGLSEGFTPFLSYVLTYIPGFAGIYALVYNFYFYRPLLPSEAGIPLHRLSNWLVDLAKTDANNNEAKFQIMWAAGQGFLTRRPAHKALLKIIADKLQPIGGIEGMANSAEIVELIPDHKTPKSLIEARYRVNNISTLAQEYLTRATPVGQAKILEDLRVELEIFWNVALLAKRPIRFTFQPHISRWLEIVKEAEAQCRRRLDFTPIRNPFVAGNPLQLRDDELFKGRKDIIVAIEENIINPGQRPALLLYGRRRIGKTSTLLNLPRLLSSQFVPVFVDCQNAKWRDGNAAFCYHLASSVYGELFQRNLLDDLRKPMLEQFEKYAFTRLDEFLDQVEALSRRINKQILLTFDEYERLEEGIAAQKITREVFNQLRNIVQHRERIVVLFSGSHRFEELRVVNWSDYLINVKTLELSFLAPEDARELLTEPVPALHYEPGVVDKIIALTHCQPYLLQAVASDLVNYLNAQKRQTATMADLDVAVAKVLVTADAYFHNNWEECAETEREVLRALVRGEADRVAAPQYQTAVQSLRRKEIVEMRDDRYLFAVELFRLWILKNHLPSF